MDFINSLKSDFQSNFLKDVGAMDIVLISLLVLPLGLTIFAKRIAKRFADDEKAQLTLSIKIKSVGLIIIAVMAFVITQVV